MKKGKLMYKVILGIVIGFTAISAANAGQTCRTDYLGNYVCTGTGANSGYNTTTRTDYLGNDVTTDNRGNTQTCRTDYLGNYVCN